MEIITSIASKIGESLVEPVGRQLAYLIFYQGNIAALVDETEKLKEKKAGIQSLMDAATRQLEDILPEVESWVRKVDEIMKELERFLEEEVKANKMCFNGWFPNLKLRHSLGRKAKKHAEVVSKLQQEGKFDKISYPPPPTGMHLLPSMKAFQSRTKILNQVMEALKDKYMHTIAICGMGGIGKTTMAKEVARRAKEEKLFEVVVMAVVSQNPIVRKIQGEIADMLHLPLTEESTIGRAEQLSNGIKRKTKILIILDDIWDRLELDAIGIPFGSEHPGCSILLTSRNVEVCSQLGSQRDLTINVLSDGEAWDLFQEVTGTSINTRDDLFPIAKQIANECRGLPAAIVTVGCALKNKGEYEWNDALHQLRKSIAENIPGMDAYVYSSIELSYKFLSGKQAKSCFLLCCLFPEDHDIPIETLVRYGKGLGIFQDTEAVEEARRRVHSLVQALKRCFLLIDSEKEGCVKMHKVVRDVALSIASNKVHGFVVRCADIIDEWPEIDRKEDCTTISLVADEINARLDNLRCPNLKLLHLSTNRISSREQEFKDDFCDQMKELKVLALQKMRIRSLPLSLRVLRDMRTLHLEYCVLEDISSIGALVKLEVLSLRGSEIQSLPREIGRLEHLKLLDITECKFNGISPGVLSSLIELEELYMRDTISRWSLGQQNREEKICAILAELIPLSDHLKVLDFDLEEIQLLPENSVFNNLTRFRISIRLKDYNSRSFIEYFFRNQLEFSGADMDAVKETGFGIHPLLEKCETLRLERVEKLNKAWMDEVCFSRLKDLYLRECMDVEYLVYTNSNLTGHLPFSVLENLDLFKVNLKALCHPDFLLEAATREFQLFHNLKQLELLECRELNYVFSTSLARGSFPQLQSLDVRWCFKMEGIVYKETGENGQNNIADDIQTIVFPKLTELKLTLLPLLISLYRDMDDNNAVQLCPSRNDIHHMTPKVPESPNILVPFKILKWLPSLERLKLSSCHKVRVVLDFHGLIMISPLPEKEKINNSEVTSGDDKEENHFHGIDYRCWCLKCLPPLDRKGKSVQGNNINNTVQKKSQDDQIITTTSSHSDAQGEVRDHRVTEQVLYNLRHLEVGWCDSVAVIFNFGEGQGYFPPVLNKLSALNLENLKELIHIWNIKNCPQQVITSSFQNLTSLQVRECPRLRYIFPPSIAKLLVALESIDVTECKSMQVIVAKNEEDENVNDVLIRSFLHLRSIYLEKLENLSCFSDQPNCAIQFPSLESVKISGCPKLDVKKLNKAWMDEVGFSRLKDLSLYECWDVEYLVYTNSNLTGQLPFSLLENLTLMDLKNLKALCHPDFLLEAATREFQLFHNLKQLSLSYCGGLNYVFSTSLARGSFPQLQSLDLSDCGKMEGIVYKETGENGQNNIAHDIQTIVFPKLTDLSLSGLPLLISLYRDMDDNNAVQLCPSRNDIHHMTPKVPESPNVLVPFKILKWLPSLEQLYLYGCYKVRVVLDFHGLIMITPLPEKEKTNNSELTGGDDEEDDHFHGIDHRCWCLKYLPPLYRKGKSIQGNYNNNTLQKKSQDDQIITTTSSHSDAQGEVRDHRVTEQVLYNLRDLEVHGCDSVAVIFNFGEGQGSFPPVLNKLSALNLGNLNELIHIWNIKNCPQQVITSSFQNLTSLQITKCPRLRYIFPPSIAKLLVALESIYVRECKSMQRIVAKNKKDENVNDVLILSFLHLRSIYLEELENLSCFSDQPNCAIQFPSLESVKINGCPKLETFVTVAAMSAEDTPKLKQVEDSDLPQPQLFYGDVNTTIKHNFGLKQEKLIQQEKQRQQEEQSSKNAIEQEEEQSSENEEEQSSENEIKQQKEQSSENEIKQQKEQSFENEIEQQEEQSYENEEEQSYENEEEQSSENEEEQSSENKIEQQEEQSSENEIEQQDKQSSENEQQEEQCSSNKMEQQKEQSSKNEIEHEEEQTSENETEQEEQGSENEIEQEEEQSSENESEQQETQSFENEIEQKEEQSSENESEQQEAQSSENESEQQEAQSTENETEQEEQSFDNVVGQQEEQT